MLEKYLNHPNRDELIAKEMGWTHLLNGDSRDWEEEVDAQFEKELVDGEAGEAEAKEGGTGFSFERHPLYRQTVALSAELDEIFNTVSAQCHEHPAAITIRSQATMAAAKLAAALNDDDVDELGMTISLPEAGTVCDYDVAGCAGSTADVRPLGRATVQPHPGTTF